MFTLKLYQMIWRFFVPLFNSYKFEASMPLPPWASFSATLCEEEGFLSSVVMVTLYAG